MNTKGAFCNCLLIAAVLTGCASLLPKSKAVPTVPWHSYHEVLTAYDKVIPGKTSVRELKKAGFDIYSTPNVKILNYLDVAASTQSLRREDLSPGIDACLKAQKSCVGYVFEPRIINSKRYGNFWLDLLSFSRKTKNTGWSFRSTFLVVDNLVVEKLWSGEPLIDEDREAVNPLGPFQELGNSIAIPKYTP
jgi:hypothetical protein